MNILTHICQNTFETLKESLFFHEKKRWVGVLGSARFPKENVYFQMARELSRELVGKEYSILTGGGYGIMEAASQGASEGNGVSAGLYVKRLELVNVYLKKKLSFYSLLSRQRALIRHSQMLIIFPGGFGTLAEFFNDLVFMQNKEQKTPIFLVGSLFWEPLMSYFREMLIKNVKTINCMDMEMLVIADSIQDVLVHLNSRV